MNEETMNEMMDEANSETAELVSPPETPEVTAPRRRRPRPGQAGLTLIEILVVVAILGLIAGIVGIQVANQLEGAKVDTANSQIKEFEKSLELYKIKFNRYPNTTEGLNALTSPPKGESLMKSIPQDPWDNEYVFVSPGTHNQKTFDLMSKGSDGVADTDDDIKNWN